MITAIGLTVFQRYISSKVRGVRSQRSKLKLARDVIYGFLKYLLMVDNPRKIYMWLSRCGI